MRRGGVASVRRGGVASSRRRGAGGWISSCQARQGRHGWQGRTKGGMGKGVMAGGGEGAAFSPYT